MTCGACRFYQGNDEMCFVNVNSSRPDCRLPPRRQAATVSASKLVRTRAWGGGDLMAAQLSAPAPARGPAVLPAHLTLSPSPPPTRCPLVTLLPGAPSRPREGAVLGADASGCSMSERRRQSEEAPPHPLSPEAFPRTQRELRTPLRSLRD
ncbi:unnamed protein product [Rangifer tarandus platyrhynchus]|uniref:Uncharacterized protein n=3 Tax=Rangifer tarandus platyrhynchus TaxID=3082113 RepID=A0AC59YH37_RANTA|nr:unnamed protein product [Rangifer tarandus platyrhynchus]CAI9695027.1 unnamed protein product [Rangifer tarandus platyrhynchus]